MLIKQRNSANRLIGVILGVSLFCIGASAGVISDKTNKPECTGRDSEYLDEIRRFFKDSNITSSVSPIEAYLIPMTDAHNTEYVGEHDKRIQFLTKFTGSTGTIVITDTKALLWTDSRYHLQAEQQVNANCWTLMKSGNPGVPIISAWINENLNKATVGVDPFLVSSSYYRNLKEDLRKKYNTVITIKRNLVDVLWNNQPSLPNKKIYPLDVKFTGQTAGEKISNIREKIGEHHAGGMIVSELDDIAWLLNLRGSDIHYSPVFYSYVILTLDELTFFVNKDRINVVHLNHFRKENSLVKIRPYDEILEGISDLVNTLDSPIIVSKNVNQAIYEAIPSNRRLEIADIVAGTKTIKNKFEVENIRRAHIRDGLALIRFLHWLETTIEIEEITELAAASKLNEFRSLQENFKGLSFETISAFGANAAIVHYAPTKETDQVITKDEIYLVDSGGQYLDGTTDVTRTMHFGQPTPYEKECFTRVLKGFIALVTSVFPVNTSLKYFDDMARRYLWQAGLNYGHGTGHGVGAFLNVHEYPPLISPASGNSPGALENMFTSNEPGYYEDGQFGIRLEDVIQVVKSEMSNAFGGQGALTFKTVTYAPIQTKMINTRLLTKHEETYLNEYHKMVFNTIGPLLLRENLNETYEWLAEQTQPIHISGSC